MIAIENHDQPHKVRTNPGARGLRRRALSPGARGQDRRSPPETRLPGMKSQREEILKLDHKKNLEDAARLLELAQGLKAELDKSDRNVLPVSSLRKAEQIEKLARSIRGRLRKF